jgi:hypothetical protein
MVERLAHQILAGQLNFLTRYHQAMSLRMLLLITGLRVVAVQQSMEHSVIALQIYFLFLLLMMQTLDVIAMMPRVD